MIALEPFLERINYNGPLQVDADTLRGLHWAHLFVVPFENLDIHLGRPISIEIEDVYAKLVTARRGGFCYEHNSLFAVVLRQLGFKVDIIEALPDSDSIRWDHMALVVHLEERWLADVGFGESFIEPLRLDETAPQTNGGKSYRLVHDGVTGHYYTLKDTDWETSYSFNLTPRQVSDFAPGCQFHQTSPDSHFTRKRVCSLPTENGRITLSGMKFIETVDGTRTERLLADEAEFEAILRQRFGIDLSA